MLKKIKSFFLFFISKEIRSKDIEILILRQQLSTFKYKEKRRPRLSRFDRLFWCLVKEHFVNWKDLLVIVKPDTVIGWHRKGFKLFWKFKSRGGRPHIPIEQINLIKEMARKNNWGAPRIQGELKYLGIELALSTVQKYMPKRKRQINVSQGWKTFLNNHMKETIAIDFFVVPSVFFKPIYGLIAICHESREILYLKLLESRNEFFVINQLKDVFWEKDYKFLIRDNDPVFGNTFKEYLSLAGFEDCPITRESPWQNGYCERAIGSVRKELLEKIVVLSLSQGNKALREYKDYYNFKRPHQGVANRVPGGRYVEMNGEISSKETLGGLYHCYSRDEFDKPDKLEIAL